MTTDTRPQAAAPECAVAYTIEIIPDGDYRRVALMDGDKIIECSRRFGTFEKYPLLSCLFQWRRAYGIDWSEE